MACRQFHAALHVPLGGVRPGGRPGRSGVDAGGAVQPPGVAPEVGLAQRLGEPEDAAAGEEAEVRPPGVGPHAGGVEGAGGVAERGQDPHLALLHSSEAGGGDADEDLAWTVGDGAGEEVVGGVEAGRGYEPGVVPSIEGPCLLGVAAGSGGGGDDAGAGAAGPFAQVREDRFVEGVEASEGPGDEVEFVLDEEVGPGGVAFAAGEAEEGGGLGPPRQHGELVDGADDEGGWLGVEVFVDLEDGQAEGLLTGRLLAARIEGAAGVGAVGHDPAPPVADALELIAVDRLGARAGAASDGGGAPRAVLPAPRSGTAGLRERIAGILAAGATGEAAPEPPPPHGEEDVERAVDSRPHPPP